MNTELLVSFVIPVFNTKEYLERCVKSIAKMNESRMEIIAVDDKSTDGSFEELLRLQTVYPMLKVLQNKQNSGVSHTRNIGMLVASGKYIAFVDSDDRIFPPCLREYAANYPKGKRNGDHWKYFGGGYPKG